MSAVGIAIKLFGQMKLPPQDLESLSFCRNSRPQDVAAWADNLPATRVNHTSVILYKALPEVARLQAKPNQRLAMLESLRPYVQRSIEGLSQSFLNKPVVLPDDAMKAAIVALALQKHITHGYCIVARDIACDEKLNDGNPEGPHAQALTMALHRAINGLGIQLMRSYQLYAATTPGLWLSLHSLYQVAQSNSLEQLPIADELLTHIQQSTLRETYQRILLLACANPNKLRQFDVSTSYKLLELWSSHIRLRPNHSNSNALFLVNPQSDRPPSPKNLVPISEQGDCVEVDVSQLLSLLDKQLEGKLEGGDVLSIPKGISSSLLSHLIKAWGTQYHRAHERMSYKQELQAVVGISSIHFHLSGGIPFESFVLSTGKVNLQQDGNPYLKGQTEERIGDDPWSNAFDAGVGAGRNFDPLVFSTLDIETQLAKREHEQAKDKFPVNTVISEDRSQGGYCLQWQENVPKSLKSGELIALKESGATSWTLGIIRWVRQSRGSSSFGVELLSALASPYGASLIHKSGDNADYMRVFFLPEQKSLRRKTSLLTPSVPFQEGQKVRLNRRGEEKTIQLTRKTMDTGSISQFEFRTLETG
ncbi:hypothetical protein [Pseudoteredinibacter isoporae]|uniref:hypothetical protein n=1 Tax=Pseudoteredinibacter isoporae TaxID=570281 RepID=UPI003340C8E6